MSLQTEELAGALYLCADECSAALVFKSQFAHLKACINSVYPKISAESAVVEETEVNISISKRALDEFETVNALLLQCSGEDTVMGVLESFVDHSATIYHSFYTLLDICNAYSIQVQLEHIVNRLNLFKNLLTDWKGALDLLDSLLESIGDDPHHNKADLIKVDGLRKKLILQFPEPDIFHRIDSVNIFPFHTFNEPREATEEEEEECDACDSAGDTNFAILSSSSGGIPVACKTLSASKLRNGSRSLKEVANLYLLTDSTSSPCVQSMLKVCFAGPDTLNIIYSLPPMGNLTALLGSFEKVRKRNVGEPGSYESWLDRRQRVEGKLSVMSDVATGLAFLHSKGIVHGRLKPSNVLVFDGYRARIADYGISPLLKVGPKVSSWLQSGREALIAGRPPVDSSFVPYQSLNIGEGGIRWIAPELLLISNNTVTGTATSANERSAEMHGDITSPWYSADQYAMAMIMYYVICEKKPFYNITWNEGVYNALLNGDRPPFVTRIPDCEGEELFETLFEDIEAAWVSPSGGRKDLKALMQSITILHQEVAFAIESRVLTQMTEKLEELSSQPEALKASIATNIEKIAKGEEAIKKKQVELDNALNGKQRKEFSAQLEKGRERLDVFIAETNALNVKLTTLEQDVKAAKKNVKSQTEKRYGGAEHILRHRHVHKECVSIEPLLKLYKGSSSKADIEDAMASANEAAGSVMALPKNALQSFFFKAADRTKSLAEEMLEYRKNATGGEENGLVDISLVELCTFACSVFEEVSISEQAIPRFAKFTATGFMSSGAHTGLAVDARRGSAAPGTFSPPPLVRERAESDLQSEKSEKAATSDYSNLSKGVIASAAARTRRDEASSPTLTDASGDDFLKMDGTQGGVSGSDASTRRSSLVGGFVPMKLDGSQLQYLAAHRGSCVEAVGLMKVGRTMDPKKIAQLEEVGETPAYIAALYGHLEVLRNLLENEGSIGASTGKATPVSEAVTLSSGQNLLHAACTGGCLRTVRYLIETYNHFGPEDSDADAMSCIHHAVARGHLGVVQYLLHKYETLANVVDEEFSATLLHWAAAHARADILLFLLDNVTEIGVNTRCCDGSTALMWAVFADSVECVRLLIENKADVYVHDKKGHTCLHIAACQGSLAMVKELTVSGNLGLIGLIDCDGNSALKLSLNNDVTVFLSELSRKKK